MLPSRSQDREGNFFKALAWLSWCAKRLSLRCFRLRDYLGLSRWQRDKLLGILLFLFLQVAINRVQIVLESNCVAVAHLTRLFNNFVVPHSQSPDNSSGVQITGGSYPAFRQIRFTAGCISALNTSKRYVKNRNKWNRSVHE